MINQKLGDRVFDVIREDWPINISDICNELGFSLSSEDDQKKSVSKISYHIKILEQKEKIRVKRIGRSVVAWPMHIEKLRIMHDFFNDL